MLPGVIVGIPDEAAVVHVDGNRLQQIDVQHLQTNLT
jgi:hypothetical protein